MGLLLMSSSPLNEDNSLKISSESQCKVDFLKSCFSFCIQADEPYQAFNYIKAMNQIAVNFIFFKLFWIKTYKSKSQIFLFLFVHHFVLNKFLEK